MEEPSQLNLSSPTVDTASVVGDLRLHEFSSRVFHNKRLLRVWLPPGYDLPKNSGQHYPVFYLTDGQNLLQRAASFAGIDWQVDESADRLIGEGVIAQTIFVVVDH